MVSYAPVWAQKAEERQSIKQMRTTCNLGSHGDSSVVVLLLYGTCLDNKDLLLLFCALSLLQHHTGAALHVASRTIMVPTPFSTKMGGFAMGPELGDSLSDVIVST